MRSLRNVCEVSLKNRCRDRDLRKRCSLKRDVAPRVEKGESPRNLVNIPVRSAGRAYALISAGGCWEIRVWGRGPGRVGKDPGCCAGSSYLANASQIHRAQPATPPGHKSYSLCDCNATYAACTALCYPRSEDWHVKELIRLPKQFYVRLDRPRLVGRSLLPTSESPRSRRKRRAGAARDPRAIYFLPD